MTVRNILTKIEDMQGVLDRAVRKNADEIQYAQDCYLVCISDMTTIRSIFYEYNNLLLDLEIKEEE